jgi:hypothetical protein
MRPDLTAAVSGPRRHPLRISALVEAESTQMTKPTMDDTTPRHPLRRGEISLPCVPRRTSGLIG